MNAHKRFITICALVIVAFAALHASGTSIVWAQPEQGGSREAASVLYNAGAFAAAADQWAEIAGHETGAVDARINAAQAYLQADDLGRAMLWFRRAQMLDPRHSAVQLGLALVRALRVDILGDEPGLMPAVERLSAGVVSRSELAWLALISWTVAFGIGTLTVLRHKWHVAVAGAIVVASLLLILLVGREISAAVSPPAVVTAFETILYSEPGTEGAALARIYAGAEVRIAERREGWTLITLADDRAGWLPEYDVVPLAE